MYLCRGLKLHMIAQREWGLQVQPAISDQAILVSLLGCICVASACILSMAEACKLYTLNFTPYISA